MLLLPACMLLVVRGLLLLLGHVARSCLPVVASWMDRGASGARACGMEHGLRLWYADDARAMLILTHSVEDDITYLRLQSAHEMSLRTSVEIRLANKAERLKQQGKLLEMVDHRLGSDYSEEQALRLMNIALLCTNTSPTQRPRMSSVVKMLCDQIPIEVTPDDGDLSEDLRLNFAQSHRSINNSKTDWSHSQMTSSDPSILLHNKDRDSGYLPSSSSSSLKL
nr:unnamed protein product [Digitaria exilis]